MTFYVSSHSLMIRAVIHQNIDHTLRLCQICLKLDVYIVKDEFHFFPVCPANEATRMKKML